MSSPRRPANESKTEEKVEKTPGPQRQLSLNDVKQKYNEGYYHPAEYHRLLCSLSEPDRTMPSPARVGAPKTDSTKSAPASTTITPRAESSSSLFKTPTVPAKPVAKSQPSTPRARR